jgi:RHS repeat-associated protein
LSYTYDNAGNVLTIASSNANGASLTYTYDVLNRLSTVTDNRLLAQGATSGVTTYNYDTVGNLQNFVYPNGVTHAYSYDTLNRLTQMGSSKNGTAISNYAYTLGSAGNRTAVTELSGRSVGYGYDSLYRLTSETVTSDLNNKNGAISYTYDAVGNRKTLSSTLPPAGATNYSYDLDDRLLTDQYDPDGNTINSLGIANTYDFENHLIAHGGVTIAYDGDGNRVSETVGGVTTNYLVDTVNPSAYAQVVDELVNGTVTRTYAYGLERIDENQTISGTWTASFYGYDGHGSVRQLTNSAGVVTDTYDYDAFGNLINSSGSTPNNYLFAGEQYDPALYLYYNRARYLDTATGRFWTVDSFDGLSRDPSSLHKYLYVGANSANTVDPSGHEGIGDMTVAFAVFAVIVVIGAGGLIAYHYLHRYDMGIYFTNDFFWRDNNSRPQPLSGDEITTVKQNALQALHLAFSAFPKVLVHEGQASDHTVEVDTSFPNSCGGTKSSPSAYSFVNYSCVFSEAQSWNRGSDRETILQAAG